LSKISQESCVDIEPENARLLLDTLMADASLELAMAGVPGAGGNDAIFVLGVKKEGASLAEKVQNAL